MTDALTFAPARVTVGRGAEVAWDNASSVAHDVTADLSGYFGNGTPGGVGPGQTYRATFPQAGRFGYSCSLHDGMRGTVVVPVSVSRLPVTGRFRVTVASATPIAPWRNEVQVRKPGATAWKTIATTIDIYVDYGPTKRGTYRFRSAVTDGAGRRSAWSPVVSATH
jgi:hypothetical protein